MPMGAAVQLPAVEPQAYVNWEVCAPDSAMRSARPDAAPCPSEFAEKSAGATGSMRSVLLAAVCPAACTVTSARPTGRALWNHEADHGRTREIKRSRSSCPRCP